MGTAFGGLAGSSADHQRQAAVRVQHLREFYAQMQEHMRAGDKKDAKLAATNVLTEYGKLSADAQGAGSSVFAAEYAEARRMMEAASNLLVFGSVR